MSSALSVSEEHNAKAVRQHNEDLAAMEEKLSAMQAEMRHKHEQIEAKCNAAIEQQDKTQLELNAAQEQIEHKNSTIARLEATLSADTARLEKKIHAQVNIFKETLLNCLCFYLFINFESVLIIVGC